MNIVNIKMKDGTNYELQLCALTQILGGNNEDKDFMLNSISKFFSKYRYSKDEEIQSENILLNGGEIGRNYFAVSYIYDIKDIELNLTLNKTSLLKDYIVSISEGIETAIIIEKLNIELQLLMDKINISLQSTMQELMLSTDNYTSEEIFKKKIDIQLISNEISNVEYLSNYRKLEVYLKLIFELNNKDPKKRLVIFRNIDMYISSSEYLKLIVIIRKMILYGDYWFVITSSQKEYTIIDEETIEGINVLNDSLFNVKSLKVLKSFVEKNYPYNKIFTDEEFIDELSNIIGDIGKPVQLKNVASQVMLKEINTSEYCEVKPSKLANLLELEYIQN